MLNSEKNQQICEIKNQKNNKNSFQWAAHGKAATQNTRNATRSRNVWLSLTQYLLISNKLHFHNFYSSLFSKRENLKMWAQIIWAHLQTILRIPALFWMDISGRFPGLFLKRSVFYIYSKIQYFSVRFNVISNFSEKDFETRECHFQSEKWFQNIFKFWIFKQESLKNCRIISEK